MSTRLRKVLAVFVALVIIFGWYVTIWGIPGVTDPVKDKIQLGLDIKGGVYAVLKADLSDVKKDDASTVMEQTQAVINERVNQMGLKEPIVTVEGRDRIRVELPGAEDSEDVIKTIGKTAQLEFRLANKSLVLTGENVEDASIDKDDEKGGYKVLLKFDKKGGKLFEQGTKDILSGTITSQYDKSEKVKDNAMLIILDDEIISKPTVDKVISGTSCEITGRFSQEDASELAALIRGGSLPVPLEVISSSSQTATIGMDALNMSVMAGLIGLAIIFLIMLFGYRIMGVAADIALLFYVVIIVAFMAVMGSVLTLPGIAGIILSVGMAVDSNVVIFSRIKEEITAGKTVRIATKSGTKRALTTVIDSQVTTLIAAVVLYEIGTSSVKGFAWTLMLGIIVSIFTAVTITGLYVGLFAESKKFSKKTLFGVNEDNTSKFDLRKKLSFIKIRKKVFCITCIAILIGVGFFVFKGFNYGIDFTGGTMVHIDMGKQVKIAEVKKVFEDDGINMSKSSIVYSGDANEQILIRTSESIENAKLYSIIDDIGTKFQVKEPEVLESVLFGPSVGKELRNNALKAVLIAALCMLIYIRIRFREWKFGAASLLAVLHDVLWMMAFYAVFRIQVNNPFIAAILTIVGYSINDTIVVFDRIRENLKYMRTGTREEIIDTSINQTLSRSIMTSVTTLVIMVPLVIMAGSAIREFVLPLMVGIIVGCCSSIFIASPLFYEFAQWTNKKKYSRKNKHHHKKNPYQGAKKRSEV